MDIRGRGFAVDSKDDASPVTEADRAAEEIILAGLRKSFPNIPVVAEEDSAQNGTASIATDRPFFLVDPLDGTREFVKGGEDFTVNIALIENGLPTVGLVHVPANKASYAGDATGAWKRENGGSTTVLDGGPFQDPIRVVASWSHRTPETNEWIAGLGPHEVVSVGSSLKFCLLAEGLADVYPRFGRTMEWDTAAGDAVLRAAGGTTVTVQHSRFVYGKPAGEDVAFANPHFIAYARSKDAVKLSGFSSC